MRRFLSFISLQLVLLFLTGNASALYQSGNISDAIHYSDLEITYRPKKKRRVAYPRPNLEKPRFIKGTLINRTGEKRYFKATLNFKNFFGKTTATAKIRKRLPAFGEADFKSKIRLGEETFSDYELDWDINTSSKKKRKKKEETKNGPGYSSIRELSNGLQITGSNAVTTESFLLKKGISIFTPEIVGKSFSASLKNIETKKRITIFSQTGRNRQNKKISLDEDGIYLMKVSAQGGWRIVILSQSGTNTGQSMVSEEEETGSRSIIYLKNGKKIIAEQLSADEKRLTFISGGSQISIGRDKVLKTEAYNQ